MSETEPITPAPPSGGLKAVFLGPNGLRAGWRLLIFLAMVLAFSVATQPLAGRLVTGLATDFSAKNVIVSEIFVLAVVLLAAAIMGKFEKRTLADYGLPFQLFLGKQFWMGALWGFVM